MKSALELGDYYSKRAAEYECIYTKPERQPDLAKLKSLVSEIFQGLDVLEVACGTGYWTEIIASTAQSVFATDINPSVLEIARAKTFLKNNVRFEEASALNLQNVRGKTFSGGVATFWWSHLEKSILPSFLAQFHQCLSPGATVVFLDNKFVAGSSSPISRTDAQGNTYQKRRLLNGEEFEIIKNFPGREELEVMLSASANNFQWIDFEFYWLASYQLAAV
ncbi:MAG TPA: class I SAM-dependent methyltransferase [Verrucomicrobiae bacterium]|nr:class I SAM-dependent methyltransferase [Verrucomicrobiae bacterium]